MAEIKWKLKDNLFGVLYHWRDTWRWHYSHCSQKVYSIHSSTSGLVYRV